MSIFYIFKNSIVTWWWSTITLLTLLIFSINPFSWSSHICRWTNWQTQQMPSVFLCLLLCFACLWAFLWFFCANFVCKIFRLRHYNTNNSCRHTDACLRKISHKLCQILDFERKTVTINSFNLILLISAQFFWVSWPFRHIFFSGLFSCAMKIPFRKSGHQTS